MNHIKHTSALAILLVACLLGGLLPVAKAATTSGSCGDNASWWLDTSSGSLSITGWGIIKSAPWLEYKEHIKSVQINLYHNSSTGMFEVRGAFENCTNLISVSMDQGIMSIQENMFKGCTSLKSITMPDAVSPYGVALIYNGAFEGCTNLTEITIPICTMSIYSDAFKDCINLKKINIPKITHYIGSGVFTGCSSLKDIVIDPSNTKYTLEDGVLFEGKTTLHTVTDLKAASSQTFIVPDGIMAIGQFAFKGHAGLTDIKLPSSLKEIKYGAFRECSNLTEMLIPNGVTKIEASAFLECSKLSNLVIPVSVATIGGGAFSNCAKQTALYMRGAAGTVQGAPWGSPCGVDNIVWSAKKVTLADGYSTPSTIWIDGTEGLEPTTTTQRQGYEVTAWKYNNTNLPYTANDPITDDCQLNAVWTPKGSTGYKVEHYTQDVAGNGYALQDTDTLQGETDSTVTASPKVYDGFSENTTHIDRYPSGSVLADGSLTLKLYYDRDLHTVSYDSVGGSVVAAQSGIRWGAAATEPMPPVKQGYNFGGWWTDESYTTAFDFITPVTADMTVYASWTARGNTKFQVEHYLQDVAGETYTKLPTDNLTGAVGTIVTAVPKANVGFHENTTHPLRITTGTIAADDSLVLALYYDRNLYKVSFDSANGTPVTPQSGLRYGATATEPPPPTRLGYTFDGWYIKATGQRYDFTSPMAKDIALYAVWIPQFDPGTVYVAGKNGNDDDVGGEYTPLATLAAAYAAVNNGGIIVVKEDLGLTTKLVLNQNKAVTINGQGNTITYTSAATIAPDKYGLLTVEAGTVTLENITVQMPTTPGANGRVLYIGTGGTVTLGNGATLANGYLGYGGGGVMVNGGAFTMGDGSAVKNSYIVNNTTAHGGGVQVAAGSFTMTGGEISGNTIHTTQGYANYGGGVAVLGGTFRMTGGTIEGNKVDTAGGGVYLGPGGVLELGGSAAITGNTVGGTANNLYLPTTNTTFEQVEAATGTIGVTHGKADYNVILGVPGTITAADEAAYSYDTGAYDIRLKSGNLVLYKWTVGVTITGTGFESSFTDVETPKGEDFDTTLTPDAGVQLPEDITVSVGGAELGQDKYTYAPNTGTVHIPGAVVTDDIIISVGPNALHTITVTLAHVDADTTTATVIQGDTTTITFTPANRYALPDTVSVTGPCDHSYAAGVLTISNVSGEIEVSAVGAEVPHTIHLDAAGGSVAPGTVTINESQPTIGGLPTPTRTGYTFTGWFTTSGDRVTATTANHLTADLHLTARWAADTNIGYQVQHWVELVDSGANPGYTQGVTTTQRMEYQGKARIYYLQSSQQHNDGMASGHKDITPLLLSELAGLDIKGLTPSGANVYSVTMAPDGSSVYPFFYDRSVYTLTFDPNGGTIAQGDAKATILHGSVYGALPPASRAGYTLSGWYTSSHGGTKIAASDVFLLAGNQTLYAHWTTTGATAYTVTHMVQKLRDNLVGYDKTPDNYSVYLTDTLYGNADATVDVYALAMPGYTPSSENVYTAFVKADGSGNVTLYYDRMITTVEYDANGGTPAAPGLRTLLYHGGRVSSLAAAPSRSGYDFDGWHTGKAETSLKATVGMPLAELDPVGGQTVTLYAHWTKQTPPIPPTPPSGGGTSAVKPPATVTGEHAAYIKGYPDGNVGPMNNILRCEAAAIFYRLLDNKAAPTGKLTFPDVPARSWYGEAVAALADMGIITGYSNGNFGPYDPITRAEFAAMATRFAGATGAVNPNDVPFDDIGRHWAKKYIVQAADHGWVQGDGSGHYRPDDHMTRAETVTLVNRVFGRNVTAAGMLPGMVTFPDNTPGAWYYADIQEAANSHEFTRAATPTNSPERWTSCNGKEGS